MSTDTGSVMLVGSVARPDDGWGAEDVLHNCGEALGDRISKVPDGEVGDRYYWINYLARHTYAAHPGLRTTSHHTFEDWKPTGYADHWRFTLADGVDELRFARLGYLDEALHSYEAYRAQRASGAIADGVRFMVAVPLIESATRPFIDSAPHWEVLWDGYAEALTRELRELCARIPHENLAIQLDVCLETAAVEGIPVNFTDDALTRLPRDPLERYALAVRTVAEAVPEDVWFGLHVCYGSLGHEEGSSADSGHFKEIADLGVSVAIANSGAQAARRQLAFVHMPVQNSRGFEQEFYVPLGDLDVGDARIYLGLIHLHDGVDGALRRVDLARRHLADFGVATQCGWGRRPANEGIDELLALHRDVADAAARTWSADL